MCTSPLATSGRSWRAPSACADAALEALRRSVPAAAALSLLEALACEAERELVVEYLPGLHLRVRTSPGAAASICTAWIIAIRANSCRMTAMRSATCAT
jgi:hypothetical protein